MGMTQGRGGIRNRQARRLSYDIGKKGWEWHKGAWGWQSQIDRRDACPT